MKKRPRKNALMVKVIDAQFPGRNIEVDYWVDPFSVSSVVQYMWDDERGETKTIIRVYAGSDGLEIVYTPEKADSLIRRLEQAADRWLSKGRVTK